MKIVLISALILAACGTDKKSSSGTDSSNASPSTETAKTASTAATPGPTSFAVDAAADLPVCTTGMAGELAYLTSSKSLVTCDGKTWQAAPLTQTVDHVNSISTCSGTAYSMPVTYSIETTSSGDVSATGTFRPSIAVSQVSGSAFYAANQTGAANGSITFSMGGGGGQWIMAYDKASNTMTVTYTGTDIPSPRAWTSTCTTANY